jgi:ubiquinone biosynthesis protein UbiJ
MTAWKRDRQKRRKEKMNQKKIVQNLHERVTTLEDEAVDLPVELAENIDESRTIMFLQDTVNDITEIKEIKELISKLEARLNKTTEVNA